MSVKITVRAYQILGLVKEIEESNRYGIAPVEEVAAIARERWGVSSRATRLWLTRLKKLDLLENPLRGCWRVTEKGLKALQAMVPAPA